MKHKLRGHLFQGCYKAIPVDGEDGTYFRTASDYIHLNPVRAGLVRGDDVLLNYRWSSFPALSGIPRRRPEWLCAEWILDRGDKVSGRKIFRYFLARVSGYKFQSVNWLEFNDVEVLDSGSVSSLWRGDFSNG